MKYTQRLGVALIALVLSLAAVQLTAFAADSDQPTAAEISQIQTNCGTIQSSLTRIHANDALQRVNRGQLYESIAANLMAPFNSRVSLNRLDSTTLVSITNNFQIHLSDFRSTYQTYEQLLSATMKIDCGKDPVKFYQSLEQARTARADVYQATARLTTDIKQYKHAFENFAKSYDKEPTNE